MNLMQEPSAADDSNEDEENDVTVEDVDTPTGQLSMNSYGVKLKCSVLNGGKSTIILHGLSQLVYLFYRQKGEQAELEPEEGPMWPLLHLWATAPAREELVRPPPPATIGR